MATFTFQSATVLGNGRVIRLVFQTGPLASAVFSTPDWQPGKAASKTISISTGAKLAYVGTCTYITQSGNTQWIVDVEIVNAADVITLGQSVTVTADAGYIQDDIGNVSGAISAAAATNYSVMGSDGFLSSSIDSGNGTGGSVTLYVSYTYGNDSRTLAQAQNVATPLKTLSGAFSKLDSNTTNGSRIRILQGDTIVETAGITSNSVSGPNISRPFLIDTYWNAYSGINATWQGKRPIISFTEAGGSLFTFANGTNFRGNIIINGLDITGNNTASTAFFGYNIGLQRFYFIDCIIRSFYYNITLQYNSDNGKPGSGWGQYFMAHRCIIVDAQGRDQGGRPHAMGIYGIGYANSLISQCVFDRCSHGDTGFDETGRYGHAYYFGIDNENGSSDQPNNIDKHPAAPHCFWRNYFSRGGSYAVQTRIGCNVYKNLFTEMDIAAGFGSAGGRFALNYVERITGEKLNGSYIGYNTWGMNVVGGGNTSADLPGQIRPVMVEMNIFANSLGILGQNAVLIDGSSRAASLSHDHIIRNNTAYLAGSIGSYGTQSTKPEKYKRQKNIVRVNASVNPNEVTPCAFDGSTSAPTSWEHLIADRNLYSTANAGAVFEYADDNFTTIGSYRSTTGQEQNTITNVTPTFRDATASLATYATIAGVGSTIVSFINALRARSLNSWSESINDTWAAIQYLMGRYYCTNQPALSDGSQSSYYGAPDGIDPTETSAVDPEPEPCFEDIKFLVNGAVFEDNETVDFGDYDYNTGSQFQSILVANYGTATGTITNLTLTNLTDNGFSLDPVGDEILQPTIVLNTFPYEMGPQLPNDLGFAGRNIAMVTSKTGSKLASFVLTGDFGTKTLNMVYNVPTVDEPSESIPGATGVFFLAQAGGLTYVFRT